MRIVVALMWLALPAGALAAPDDPVPRIVVSASGSSETPPDRAIVVFSIRGEGATSDEAVKALVARRFAIEGGIATFRQAGELTAGQLSVNEVRGRECQGYPPQLSVGACAVLGYRAEMEVQVRVGAVKEVGTMVGLIGRLGGTNPHITGFGLTDDAPARARAMAIAFQKARAQAEALASAGKVRLVRLLSASDNGASYRPDQSDIIVTGQRVDAPPPPPPPPPPIAVSLTPKPIETRANVTLVYEVAP